MKKMYLLFIFCLSVASVNQLQAASGIFDSFAILNVNGSGNTFYDLSASTGNADFQGTDLGVFDASMQSIILGGQAKIFKTNGTDVTGVSIFYRIYPMGSPSGAFIEIPYSFQFNNAGGNSNNQQWGTEAINSNPTDGSIEILTGTELMAGSYVLEVYVRSTTNGVDAATEIFDNNGGSNYQATFTVSSQLPVTLTHFTAKLQTTQVTLNWATSSEINNSHFELQRSTDTKQWTMLDKVLGAGNSLETINYNFVDVSPLKTTNYYRLKQVDFDGAYEYSPIVSVVMNEKEASVYPTLASSEIVVTQAVGDATLYDMSGKFVRQFQITDDVQTLDIQDLINGKYLLKLTKANGTIETVWVVKQ
jgi:hypothetical protein